MTTDSISIKSIRMEPNTAMTGLIATDTINKDMTGLDMTVGAPMPIESTVRAMTSRASISRVMTGRGIPKMDSMLMDMLGRVMIETE